MVSTLVSYEYGLICIAVVLVSPERRDRLPERTGSPRISPDGIERTAINQYQRYTMQANLV